MGNQENTDNIEKAKVSTDEKFIQDALKAHNEYRAKHGVPAMTLNDELCQVAQSWAEAIGDKGALQHSTSEFGENIFWSSKDPTEVDGNLPVDKWYSEFNDFNWSTIDYQKGTGHFTQVIWKESTELGIAKAKGKNGSTYVVANYRPGGNMSGDYDKNIFPLL